MKNLLYTNILVMMLCLLSFNLYADPRFDDRLINHKFINKNNTIYFYVSEDLAFAGFSGCNNFTGSIKINKQKSKIAFLGVSSTRKYCDDEGVKRAERELFYNFAKASSYTFRDGVLNLLDGNYKVLTSFKIVN